VRSQGAVTSLISISPHCLLADIEASMGYYCNKLGFETNIQYEDFYASVRRDGAEIHLKRGEQFPGERQRRQQNGHLDAYVNVDDIRDVCQSVTQSGAMIFKEIETRPWGVQAP
jgi:uncharacterized glyoxalase superfamily protein PhnB